MDEKRLFGEIAIELGLITREQLRRGLDHQQQLRRDGLGHKLLGVILVEQGVLTSEQVFAVLNAYEHEQAGGHAGAHVKKVSLDQISETVRGGLRSGTERMSLDDTLPMDDDEPA